MQLSVTVIDKYVRVNRRGRGVTYGGRGFSLEGTKPFPVVLTSPPAGIVFHGLVHA